MKRALKIGLVLVLLLGMGLWAFIQGWHVSRHPPEALSALLRPADAVYKPPGDGPFPAVLLFHGCGGIGTGTRKWAELFRDRGFVAVIVDSLKPRGLADKWQSVCNGVRLWGRERAGDVLVTLHDVRKLPFVDKQRIVLAGWSHGAWSVMDLVKLDPPAGRPTNLASLPGGLEGVRGLLLVYPYCGFAALTGTSGWCPKIPALMLLAEKDTVVATPECLAAAEGLKKQGQPITTHVYPGIDHCFDEPGIDPPLKYVPEAEADARARVTAFLDTIKNQ